MCNRVEVKNHSA